MDDLVSEKVLKKKFYFAAGDKEKWRNLYKEGSNVTYEIEGVAVDVGLEAAFIYTKRD